MGKQKSNKSRIVLYADEFDEDVWEQYCEICDVPYDSSEITIYFDTKDVEAG